MKQDPTAKTDLQCMKDPAAVITPENRSLSKSFYTQFSRLSQPAAESNLTSFYFNK